MNLKNYNMITTNIKETKDHATIKNWIVKHQGTPARLSYDSNEREADPYYKDPLTVWFEKDKQDDDNTYQALEWDEWFAVFDHHDFTFQYESEEENDRYCKVVVLEQ